MDRSTPAAGSMTYGTYRSPVSWSSRTGRGRSALRAWSSRSRSGWRRPRARPTGCRRSRTGTRCRRCGRSSATASPRGARTAAGSPRCMPRSMYQASRVSIQYSCHSSSVPGLTKNSISICSNSRVRKMKLPGVISLRNDLPIWPMPNGDLLARGLQHVAEVDEDALRGLRPQIGQPRLLRPRSAPRYVRSIPLNMRGSVNSPLVPQCGQAMSVRPFSGGWPCFSS